MIKAIYQPQGVSSHQLARDFGKSIREKATHTGTLDPMAEGVMVILTGDDRFKKETLGDVKKTYQFEILWGISTDSLDLLGLITEQKYKNNEINIENRLTDFSIKKIFSKKELKSIEYLGNYLNKYIGKLRQKLPNFSAKRIKGESAFDYAKRGEEVPDFYREVEIFEAKVLSLKEVKGNDLKTNILERINNVQGDFRQEEVLAGWKEFFDNLDGNLNGNDDDKDMFLISQCEVTSSKRTYIRALVRDLAEDLSIPATTYSIVRTKNGQYGIEDCTDL